MPYPYCYEYDYTPRLREIAALQDGFLDGHGKAPTRGAVQMAWDVCNWLGSFQRPGIYPTEAGGVQLEWSGPRWEVEIVAQPCGKAVDCWAARADGFADEREGTFYPHDPSQHWWAIGDWLNYPDSANCTEQLIEAKPLPPQVRAKLDEAYARIKARRASGEERKLVRVFEDESEEERRKSGEILILRSNLERDVALGFMTAAEADAALAASGWKPRERARRSGGAGGGGG